MLTISFHFLLNFLNNSKQWKLKLLHLKIYQSFNTYYIYFVIYLHLYICLSIHLSTFLSIYLLIYLSIQLFIYLSLEIFLCIINTFEDLSAFQARFLNRWAVAFFRVSHWHSKSPTNIPIKPGYWKYRYINSFLDS